MADSTELAPNGSDVASPAAIRVTGLVKPHGYCYGFSQKCVRMTLEVVPTPDLAKAGRGLAALFDAQVPGARGLPAGAEVADPVLALVRAIVDVVERLHSATEIPFAGDAKVLSAERARTEDGRDVLRIVIAVPSFKPHSTEFALSFAADVANALLTMPQGEAAARCARHIGRVLDELRRDAPHCDNNTRHLIRAGQADGIPMAFLLSGLMQFGWGSRGRLLWSLATEATSVIGARISGNKLATAALLRAMRIPVPPHEAAPDRQAAVAIARRIGFPAVVKPADSEKGQGASARLRDEGEVERAYDIARAVSPNVMVEKHVEGREYRLLVVNGKLFWAFERVPAHVIGDGVSSVAQLIERYNAHRLGGPGDGLGLRKIVAGPDLDDWLLRQGLTPASVPGQGDFVRLQSVPRVADGGDVVGVMDRVHPDNAAIAERAARIMRLDIAGIDLLIPDIGKSWREAPGGWITEVASVPQLSPLSRADIFSALLKTFLGGNGRVPVALVVGANAGTIVAGAGSRLAQAGLVAGLASEGHLSVGGEVLSDEALEAASAALTLITHPAVDAMVLAAAPGELLRQGLPVDRIDLLVIASDPSPQADLKSLLLLARPHLTGKALVMEGGGIGAVAVEVLGEGRVMFAQSQDDLAETLATALSGGGDQ
ncbi:MAG: ATP-grasp domain-containing protein [Novosphingobium sp.]|nr:ATP-grasp domain-containing protein [Novosphingobium sp.]